MTLEEVREAFELWRTSRLKRGPIPESLWFMVQELFPCYKKSQITKALGMNSAQLELGCQKNRLADEKTQSGFAIGYPHHQSFSMMQQPQQRCELTLKGLHKSLHMNMDVSQLAHVLPLVERYL